MTNTGGTITGRFTATGRLRGSGGLGLALATAAARLLIQPQANMDIKIAEPMKTKNFVLQYGEGRIQMAFHKPPRVSKEQRTRIRLRKSQRAARKAERRGRK